MKLRCPETLDTWFLLNNNNNKVATLISFVLKIQALIYFILTLVFTGVSVCITPFQSPGEKERQNKYIC